MGLIGWGKRNSNNPFNKLKVESRIRNPEIMGLSKEQIDSLDENELRMYAHNYENLNSPAVLQIKYEHSKREKITNAKVDEFELHNADTVIGNNVLNSNSDTLTSMAESVRSNLSEVVDSATNPATLLNNHNYIILAVVFLITGYFALRKG